MRISGVKVTIENDDGTLTDMEFGGDTGTIISGGTFSQSADYHTVHSIWGPSEFERTGTYQFDLRIGYQYKPTEEELEARAEAEEKQKEANRKWNEMRAFLKEQGEDEDLWSDDCNCDLCLGYVEEDDEV